VKVGYNRFSDLNTHTFVCHTNVRCFERKIGTFYAWRNEQEKHSLSIKLYSLMKIQVEGIIENEGPLFQERRTGDG